MELNNIIILSIVLFSIVITMLVLTAYVVYKVRRKFNLATGEERRSYYNRAPGDLEFEQATVHFEETNDRIGGKRKSNPRYKIINKLRPGLSIRKIRIYKPSSILSITKGDFSWLKKNANDNVFYVLKDNSGEIVPVTRLQIPIVLN